MSELRAMLKGLREEAKAAGVPLVKRSLLGATLTVAISADERGGATLAIRSEPSDSDAFGDLRDSEGISFSWVDGGYGPGRWFVAQAAAGETGDFFDLICEDVEPYLLLPVRMDAIAQFAARVREWQRFLAVGKGGLGVPKQMGLWGELVVLRALATNIGWNRALKGWVGPGGASQDFRLDGLLVEIKTVALGADALSISSLEQLSVSDGSTMYLAHYGAAVVAPQEGEPLPDAVLAIRNDLRDDALLRGDFENRLLGSGYHRVHEGRYTGRGFVVRTCDIYAVGDDFPRLDRDSVPSQVKNARYGLLVKGLSRFAVQPGQLPRELQGLSRTFEDRP
jgi:hypothetical protein